MSENGGIRSQFDTIRMSSLMTYPDTTEQEQPGDNEEHCFSSEHTGDKVALLDVSKRNKGWKVAGDLVQRWKGLSVAQRCVYGCLVILLLLVVILNLAWWRTYRSLAASVPSQVKNGKASKDRAAALATVSEFGLPNVTTTGVQQIEFRLVGGSDTSGRVEVLHNGTWKPVCDSGWDQRKAVLVCDLLGFRGATTPQDGDSRFGSPTDDILWEVDIDCHGDEVSLGQCRLRDAMIRECNKSEAAKVLCADVRLVGGSDSSGRVEVYHNNQWRAVCDKQWDDKDAAVVCRSLGHRGGVALAGTEARFGTPSGEDFWLTHVDCKGDGSQLSSCGHEGWGMAVCTANQSAKVTCTDVRLVDGGDFYGQVEVYHRGTWKAVCYHSSGKAVSISDAIFGNANHPEIWLDYVDCNGDEATLSECSHPGWGQENCTRGQVAYVVCSDVRLTGGSKTSGNVEVYHNGIWRAVCGHQWDKRDALVVCRSLGFGGGSALGRSPHSVWDLIHNHHIRHFGSNFRRYHKRQHTENGHVDSTKKATFWLNNVDCSGNETSLSDCSHGGWEVENCQRYAEVFCTDVRVVGGTRSSGRVEVHHNGTWMAVCDHEWDQADAAVVCRSLGLSGGTPVIGSDAGIGNASHTEFWLDHLDCNGTEATLSKCKHHGWGMTMCTAGQAAQVKCTDVRLVGGSERSGRVEIIHGGVWKGVCDDAWDDKDAMVVCRSLGFGKGVVPLGAIGSASSSDFWLDEVACRGEELSLSECGHAGWEIENCHRAEPAGVFCADVRLVGGTELSGRVEVVHDGMWKAVCDQGWDQNDAAVVCQSLSLSDGVALKGYDPRFGNATSDDFWLGNVDCGGSEKELSNCSHSGWGVEHCTRGQAAKVICRGWGRVNCTKDEAAKVICRDVRLRGGSHRSGRVEIQHNGMWKAVCDTNWDHEDAMVVCRSLGFGDATALLSSDRRFGDESTNFRLSNVNCTGQEASLSSCENSGWGEGSCARNHAAKVECRDVRVVGGTNMSGRVEVYHDGKWQGVCDKGWDKEDAMVVCHSLELSGGVALNGSDPQFGNSSTSNFWLEQVTCNGDEVSLSLCNSSGWGTNNCSMDQAAKVICEVPGCPIGYEAQFGGSCYKFVRSTVNWFNANHSCVSDGAALVSLETRAERLHIERVLNSDQRYSKPANSYHFWGYWISANDLGHDGTYTWISNGRNVTESNWHPGEPNILAEHCAELVLSYEWRWFDNRCLQNGISYICEIDILRHG